MLQLDWPTWPNLAGGAGSTYRRHAARVPAGAPARSYPHLVLLTYIDESFTARLSSGPSLIPAEAR